MNATTTTLTWTADKGLGTHGGFRAAGWELYIMRDQSRHYTLWGPDDAGEKGYLCKGSLAKCKARAEEIAGEAEHAADAALTAAADELARPEPDAPPAATLPPYDEHVEQQAREQPCGTCGLPVGDHDFEDMDADGNCLRTPDEQLDPSEREDPRDESERAFDAADLASQLVEGLPVLEPEPTPEQTEAAYDRACPCLPEIEAAVPMPAAERRTEDDTQTRVNELVWENGLNVRERADRKELLARFGLALADLSSDALDRAKRYVTERTYETGPLVWGKMEVVPFTGSSETAEQWRTRCGRYRVLRVLGADPRFAAAARVNKPGARERHIGDARNLGAALDLVAAYHARLLGEPATDNAEKVVRAAERNGTHKITRPAVLTEDGSYNNQTSGDGPDVETITRDGRTVMQISEAKARALLAACGVPETAAVMLPENVGRLQKRLNDAAKMAGYERPADAELGGLYDQALGAIEAGTEITVKTAGGKAGQAKPGKADGKAKAAGEKTKPQRQSREGGPSSKEVIHREWKKSKEKAEVGELVKLVKGAVQEGTVRGWLSAWKRGQNLPGYVKK